MSTLKVHTVGLSYVVGLRPCLEGEVLLFLSAPTPFCQLCLPFCNIFSQLASIFSFYFAHSSSLYPLFSLLVPHDHSSILRLTTFPLYYLSILVIQTCILCSTGFSFFLSSLPDPSSPSCITYVQVCIVCLYQSPYTPRSNFVKIAQKFADACSPSLFPEQKVLCLTSSYLSVAYAGFSLCRH